MESGVPSEQPPPPDAVAEIASDRPARLVWRNELGGLTFEVGRSRERRCFVKWAPAGSRLDLSAEAARLEWAVPFTPVPRLLGSGADIDGSWIITSPLAGESAVTPRRKADPRGTVRALGEGLRALHEALPVGECPFSWSVDKRLEQILQTGRLDPALWDPLHRHLSLDGALELLRDPPETDRLVVCHGDACSPNTLIDIDGRWSGHVDMGALGLADRWADLAVATWSTNWNYGPGYEDLLLKAYGVKADPWRTEYYRLLWDLDP